MFQRNEILEKLLRFGRWIIPAKVFSFFSPVYHWLMAFFAAVFFRFPSRKIIVVGVTGTKGKTTVIEILNAILEEAKYKTALLSTLRFKIDNRSWPNEFKMTMPGRFLVQKFLKQAVKEKCQYAILETTSPAAGQFRHKFIDFDAMIFTNLASEHIEAHGSFEKYRKAKLELFRALQKSKKRHTISIINTDDENAEYFLRFKAKENLTYSLKDCSYKLTKYGVDFDIGNKYFSSKLLGEFNLYNILAAMAFARSQAVDWEIIKDTLRKFRGVPGRVEFVDEGQDFKVVVDYAHTPDSLEKLYELFQGSKKICVLGAAGGGRDKWKRKEFGRIASVHCDEIILTNEDPYDENPKEIINEIGKGIASPFKYKMILDRREAIAEALRIAKNGDTVLITGKGTELYIMGPKGTKTDWDDRNVAREELKKLKSF